MQFLRIYRMPEFLTLHVKSLWLEVDEHLMFTLIFFKCYMYSKFCCIMHSISFGF